MENDTSDAESGESWASKYKGLLILFVLVLLIQSLLGYVIYRNHCQWTERGQFGDMFGAVNTLFSGLAFAGVIYAIFLQRQELEYQRDELRLTRTELNRPIVTARTSSFDSGGNTGTALNIVVENTGTRPAKNVRLSVSPKDLAQALAAKEGDTLRGHVESCFSDRAVIPILANGKSVSNSFGWLSQDSQATWKVGARLDVEVTYQDLGGRDFTHKIPLLIADDIGFAGGHWKDPDTERR